MAASYKTIVESFTTGSHLMCGCEPSSIPPKYSSKGFDIGRFMNYLFIKKTDPETWLYRTINHNGATTIHVGIKILKTITVKTPKDLLKFVFSFEGNDITEVIHDGIRYVCAYHSLFVDEDACMSPIFLTTVDTNLGRCGLIVFSDTVNTIGSSLASAIMGSLVPLVSINGGRITIERKNVICRWVCKRNTSSASIRFTPKLGLDIAKYYEKVWKNG